MQATQQSQGPLSERPSIAVIGSGAVGSYYGARLAQAAHDVHFLLRSDYEAVKKSGLTVKSCAGNFALPPDALHVYRSAGEMPKVDWVFVTLKTTSNDQFEPLIAPLLKDDTAILTLQNGLGNEERLAELFGKHRILGGMAFTCINRIGPGLIDHTAHGHIRLGEFGGGKSRRADHVATLLNAAKVPCDVLDDLRYGRWEKLVWNIPFNGLSTVLDQTTDQILATEAGVQLVRRIMQEVLASARAVGVTIEDSLIDVNINRTLEMGAYRSSMQVDRQMGRDLEVEAILGNPARVGAGAGANNPTMQDLYALASMVRAAVVAKANRPISAA
jgi:2-dehydropantoate 2-reductase